MTQYPRGTISLGVVLRGVALASWVDNHMAAETKNYVATLATDKQVQEFCTSNIRIHREPDLTTPVSFPGHFEVKVQVQNSEKELTAFVPCDPVRMFGSLEIASVMTAEILKATYANRDVQDGNHVVMD